MSLRIRKALPLAALLPLIACGHTHNGPPVLLKPGYYELESTGVFRRLIVGDGRFISYDIWRAPRTESENAIHRHYDLVSATASPMSGEYAITQEGSDCGTATLEPYVDEKGHRADNIIVFRMGDVAAPFGGGGTVDPDRYARIDRSLENEVANAPADAYSKMGWNERFDFSILMPECNG